MTNKPYLIEFRYDHYCQGYEDATTMVVVMDEDYESAVKKIQNDPDYYMARDFKNKTIE